MEAFHIDEEQCVVFPLVKAKIAFLNGRLLDDVLAHIIHATATFVYGFPNHSFVRRASCVRERLVLHPDGAPHVVFGIEDGDVGIIGAVLQGVGETCLVLVIEMKIWPPVVAFAIEGTIAKPAWEGCFEVGRVVEAVEYTMGHARHG